MQRHSQSEYTQSIPQSIPFGRPPRLASASRPAPALPSLPYPERLLPRLHADGAAELHQRLLADVVAAAGHDKSRRAAAGLQHRIGRGLSAGETHSLAKARSQAAESDRGGPMGGSGFPRHLVLGTASEVMRPQLIAQLGRAAKVG